MAKTYYEEQNEKKILKIRELRKDLPIHTNQFFVGIESRTTPQTRINYARDLKNFYEFLANEVFFKDIKTITIDDLNLLTASEIEMFLDYLSVYENNGVRQTNDVKSKARKLSTVRSFFKYLFNRDLLKSNVASKVPLPKLREKPIIRLTSDEVEKVLDKTENLTISSMTQRQKSYNEKIVIRDIALLSLFLGTGIRISECVGINLSDVDFSQNAFKITRKGGNQSIQYFSDEVAMALGEYLLIRNEVFNPSPNEDAFFVSIQGKRLSARSIQKLVKKYTESTIPLKHITPHKLRSTYGTNLYNSTRDIFVVAEVLGHKDVNTTKKYYAAISEEIKKEASEKVQLRKNYAENYEDDANDDFPDDEK